MYELVITGPSAQVKEYHYVSDEVILIADIADVERFINLVNETRRRFVSLYQFEETFQKVCTTELTPEEGLAEFLDGLYKD